mgnify:CR=1 FL=1
MIFPALQDITLDAIAVTDLDQLAFSRFFPVDYSPLPWNNILSLTVITLDQVASLEYSDAFVLDMDPDGSDDEPVEPEEPVVGFDPTANYNFTQTMPLRLTVILNWRSVKNARVYQVRVNGVVQARVHGRSYRMTPTESPLGITVEALDSSDTLLASFEYISTARTAFERVKVLWVSV